MCAHPVSGCREIWIEKMTAVLLHHSDWDVPAPSADTSDEMRKLLNTVRLAALKCRSAARSELFEACAVLSMERKAAQNVYVTALIKGLATALPKRPIFFRPGVSDLSFDEIWLTSALRCCNEGDWASVNFLLRSRIAPQHRRNILFLLHGVVGHRK